MRITDYVMMLPHYKQERIKAILVKQGINDNDLEEAMCSRLSDLDEHISLEEMHEFIKED